MLSHQASTIITIIFYAGSTLLGLWGMLNRKTSWQSAGCWLALAGFIFQTLTLALGFHKSFPSGLSAGAYLQMLAWFLGLSGLIIWLKLKQRTALTFATPFCLTLFAMSIPYMEQVIIIPQSVQSSFYFLHIGALFVSLALLAISFIASAIFLILEHRIKTKRGVKGFLQDLPALAILDKLNGFGIIISFPLYTIGLIVGFLRAAPVYGSTFSGDPKEIVTIIIWLLLAVIFHNRLARSWTGKKPALMMIGIFLLSIFSLLVVNTIMPSHHAFIRP
ncbi:MAG: cytochrome c biogenesis protein CcsA [Desulfovibrionaceae bacterium]|nr:cytochrome c biogenesis protein CcsA [Desulfovibrionaceae bacterium]